MGLILAQFQLKTKINMEDFKIDIFSEENKGKSFPEFKSLSEKQCLQIKSAFFEKSKLDESITVIGLLDWLRSSATLIPDLNADTEIFNLLEIIRSVSTSKPDYVNINWYQFDDIDKFKIEDLSNYFKYISNQTPFL